MMQRASMAGKTHRGNVEITSGVLAHGRSVNSKVAESLLQFLAGGYRRKAQASLLLQ